MCFHSRVPGPDILLRITILYADVRRTKFICRCSHLPVFLLLLCVLLYCCCCSCCCSSSCAGWQELLLWFIASNPRVFFLSIQTRLIFNVRTPWQYCRICSLDLRIIRIVHPRNLQACPELRRASARRGQAPLVNVCTYRYVGHVVSVIEKSDLDQALSRKRPRSR